jgi:UPF0148 protein
MEDKKISEMAELLCKGAKMLSYYCPDCKVPLFQENARIFCPSCGRNVIVDEETQEVKAEVEKGEGKIQIVESAQPQNASHLKPTETIKRAIERLSQELERENDAEKINELIDTMYKAVEVIEKLKKLY